MTTMALVQHSTGSSIMEQLSTNTMVHMMDFMDIPSRENLLLATRFFREESL